MGNGELAWQMREQLRLDSERAFRLARAGCRKFFDELSDLGWDLQLQAQKVEREATMASRNSSTLICQRSGNDGATGWRSQVLISVMTLLERPHRPRLVRGAGML